MGEKCLCEPNEILIFSCAGSSNVSQIANQAAIYGHRCPAVPIGLMAGIAAAKLHRRISL